MVSTRPLHKHTFERMSARAKKTNADWKQKASISTHDQAHVPVGALLEDLDTLKSLQGSAGNRAGCTDEVGWACDIRTTIREHTAQQRHIIVRAAVEWVWPKTLVRVRVPMAPRT